MSTFGRVVGVVLLALGLVAPLGAQTVTSGSLQGTIKDTEGGVLPGVGVTVSSEALVARRMRAITDERGGYRFPSLPPGSYTIEAELAGFASVRQEGVRIRLGQALVVDITMQLAAVAEQLTVTGDAPLVSVVDNAVSASIDRDFLARQPLQRNYYSVIAAAPGLNGMLAYGGTQQRQNAFTLDGVNVADPSSGEYWLLPSIQWMEEIQVGGLGADAEYGGYTGGIVNAVTKSGGNTVAGALEFYYEPESWVSRNTDEKTQDFSLEDASLSIGGPIAKDRVWFFVSGQHYREQTTPIGAYSTSDRKVPRGLGKVTLQASEANRLMLMAEYDGLRNERRWSDAYTFPEATAKQDGPNQTFALSWESLVSSNNFLNLKLTGFDGRNDYLPYNGWDTPGRWDYDSEISWVNLETGRLQHRQLKTVDGSWSLFADGLLGASDSHAFKFGGAYEDATISDDWKRPGGFTYYDDSSYCDSFEEYLADPTCGRDRKRYGAGEYHLRGQHHGLALYAQDSLRVSRVTVNAGIRYGAYVGGFKYGTKDVYDVSFFDPRLGVVWDMRGNGRSALKGHWGRYHGSMFTYLYDREASGQSAQPSYDCWWNSDTGAYDDCDEPTIEAARMGEVDHQYVDETLLTFEQQLGRDLSVGVDLIDRRFRNIMAMINANDDYETIIATGNPFGGGTLPIYNLLSPQDYVLTTDNGAYRDYRSVVVRINKRYSHGWSASSSLVWADLKGNIYSNSGYDSDYQDKNGFTNLDGKMEGFNKWELKLSASVDLPFHFVLSGFYTYRSGEYWTPYARIRGLDYNAIGGNYVYLTPRGSQQLPDQNLVDLKLAWTARLSGALKLSLSFEGFNVFNEDTPLGVAGRWGDYRISTGRWTPNSNFGTTTTITRPRELRAGIKLEF
ncbi:MAG TPA: carboxypeptidase regulatory-like domain-containing protein [Thermoanaerobaculaceae bacterium]|mgnify:CR=1 FL=1|nr:carboxypeptidase regulatory-like domain-containing protein [Thermoanaerobaculaceae bacterium]HRS16185.1 carboxypeptidase regulatory-like domain-containing protein [Thermoanaerobaculaceae bacterium]